MSRNQRRTNLYFVSSTKPEEKDRDFEFDFQISSKGFVCGIEDDSCNCLFQSESRAMVGLFLKSVNSIDIHNDVRDELFGIPEHILDQITEKTIQVPEQIKALRVEATERFLLGLICSNSQDMSYEQLVAISSEFVQAFEDSMYLDLGEDFQLLISLENLVHRLAVFFHTMRGYDGLRADLQAQIKSYTTWLARLLGDLPHSRIL